MGRRAARPTARGFPALFTWGGTNAILAQCPRSNTGTLWGEAMALPEVGSKAHDFTLPNQDGKNVSLADYAGNNVLIWFYPRAFGGN